MNKKTIAICACLIISLNCFSQTDVKQEFLFDSDSVLSITLTANMNALLNDRADDSKYHPLLLSYPNNGEEVMLRAEAKTRGHFRKQKVNCSYPPLLLHFFQTDSLQSSLFSHQQKLKLVMPCRGDEYVVYEWLTYKLYNIITPESFKARLVRVSFNDEMKKKTSSSFYGILLEDENEMASRNNETIVTKKLQPQDVKRESFLKTAVFEYLIGNTDWSVQYLQNIKLVTPDSTQEPGIVPYDFDHAGIVNAPYALPAEELEMTSVKERRYRGYCIPDIKEFDSVVALYNNRKPAIYNLYTSSLLLDKKYIKTTTRYLDDFYETINNTVALKKEFGYPCDKNGTGNIIIKGLSKKQQ